MVQWQQRRRSVWVSRREAEDGDSEEDLRRWRWGGGLRRWFWRRRMRGGASMGCALDTLLIFPY
eukprot:593920-Rhodomonas_salina.1